MDNITKKIVFAVAIIVFGILVNLLQRKGDHVVLLENMEKKYEKVTINSLDDIVFIEEGQTEIKPIVYDVNEYDFSTMHVTDKKRAFVSIILPAVLIAETKINAEKEMVENIIYKLGKSSRSEKKLLEEKFKKYRIEDNNHEKLLERMALHPLCITLAQAAIETGWGTSRFFRIANNIFGVWSFSESDNRIEALGSREGQSVYLKKYDSLYDSVYDYYLNISRHPAYQEFREASYQTDDYREITKYLDKYSEIREEYVVMLNNLIKFNSFEKYNEYELSEAW